MRVEKIITNIEVNIDFVCIQFEETANKFENIFRYGENTEPQPHP